MDDFSTKRRQRSQGLPAPLQRTLPKTTLANYQYASPDPVGHPDLQMQPEWAVLPDVPHIVRLGQGGADAGILPVRRCTGKSGLHSRFYLLLEVIGQRQQFRLLQEAAIH